MYIPDFHANDVTVEDVVQALHNNGCCALRSIIPLSWLDLIRKRVEIEYTKMDELFERGTMTEEEYRHCYRYGILRPFEDDYELENGQWMSEVMLDCVSQTLLKDVYRTFF